MLISNNQSESDIFKIQSVCESKPCLCGSQKAYAECCMPFHHGIEKPMTAEQLMRSRFSAFELHLETYLMESWDEKTRPGHIDFTPGLHWTKLVINGRKQGRKKDRQGWVTFVAYYQVASEEGHLHEKSFFTRNENGAWQYVDGEIKN